MTPEQEKTIRSFQRHLIEEEKSRATQDKYVRDITAFFTWLGVRPLDKQAVLDYKAHIQTGYAPASVNSMLSSLNSVFDFMERHDLHVKTLKIQRQTSLSPDKELTKAEYERLLRAAQKQGKDRLYWLMQTICSTGIRVSELRFITAEAVKLGYADVTNKGRRRRVYLPKDLCRALKAYMTDHDIKKGPVFVTRSGKVMDRTNIWVEMKKLCRTAGISEKKVFPHNLRHLFARTHYTMFKDVVRLADILGHASVDTTRIYTADSGETQRWQVQRLGLVLSNQPKMNAT